MFYKWQNYKEIIRYFDGTNTINVPNVVAINVKLEIDDSLVSYIFILNVFPYL